VELGGSVVLITGGSSGIGAAAARAIAARGARVLVSGRDEDALQRVVDACVDDAASPGTIDQGPRVVDVRSLTADLGSPAGCADLAERAIGVHGRVDVLVSSAGIGAAGPFAEISPESIVELTQINLVAPLLLARALLPGMRQRRHGHLMMVGSIAGLTGVADEAVYAATKGGLDLFAESLRLECHGSGVGVSTVIPGVVRTAFFERRGVPYERRWPRLLEPERLAEAIVRGIERDRAETIIPKWLSLAPRARGLSRTGYRFLARRFGNK
jgi:short-subunit dehydrogenase